MQQGFSYAPVIETTGSDPVVADYQYETLASGNVNKVPILIGMCSEEGLVNYDSKFLPTLRYQSFFCILNFQVPWTIFWVDMIPISGSWYLRISMWPENKLGTKWGSKSSKSTLRPVRLLITN